MYKHTDQRISVLLPSLGIKVTEVDISEVSVAVTQDNQPSDVSIALNYALAISAFNADMGEQQCEFTAQCESDGPIKMLVAKCNNQGYMRATARWSLPSQHTGRWLIENGKMIMTKRNAVGIPNTQSIVMLNGDSLQEDLTHYLLSSATNKTWARLHANPTQAKLIEIASIHKVEPDCWGDIIAPLVQLSDEEWMQLDYIQQIKSTHDEKDIIIAEQQALRFQCSCSIEKMRRAIILMGKDEAMQTLEAKQSIHITCEYCGSNEYFSRAQVEELFQEDNDGDGATLH